MSLNEENKNDQETKTEEPQEKSKIEIPPLPTKDLIPVQEENKEEPPKKEILQNHVLTTSVMNQTQFSNRTQSNCSSATSRREFTKKKTSSAKNLETSKKELDEYLNFLSCSTTKKPLSKNKKFSSEMVISSEAIQNNRVPNSSAKCLTKEERDQMFLKTYERFNQKQKENHEKIERMKKEELKKEEKLLRKVPKINNYSKKIAKTEDDFLTRMKKNDSNLLKKKQQLAEIYEKKENDKINKGKIRVQRKEKANPEEIKESISKMYEWDRKRKEKIDKEKKKNEEKALSHIQSRPQINKHSNKIATSKNKQLKSGKLIDRLYKEDPDKLNKKKMLLKKVYAPSFQPKINTERKLDKGRNKALSSEKDYLTADIENIIRNKVIKKRGKARSVGREM